MSFSSDVKEELSKHIPTQRHCQIAEIAAIITMCADILISAEDKFCIRVTTENLSVARKYFTLLHKTFNIKAEVVVRCNMSNRNARYYKLYIREHEDAIKVLLATKLINSDYEFGENMSLVSNIVIAQPCCKRAFIRGAFLASGSISDPNKSYHYEIVCESEAKANQLMNIINTFDMDAKVVKRQKHFIAYLKDGTQIVDMLGLMEAHLSLMNLENVRIVKEVRNRINRAVNCETANLNKTIGAAVKQNEDIKLIDSTIGLDKLPEALYEVAMIRMDNFDISLKEIGESLNPPVGKSGVNHRFKKIGEIAEDIRNNRRTNL